MSTVDVDINVAGFKGKVTKAQVKAIEASGKEFAGRLAGVLSVDGDAMTAEAAKCERLAETIRERDMQAYYRGRALAGGPSGAMTPTRKLRV